MRKIKITVILLLVSFAGLYCLYHVIPFSYNYVVQRSIRRQVETIRQLSLIKRVNTSTLSRAKFIAKHTKFADAYYVPKPLSGHIKLLGALSLVDRSFPLRQRLIKHRLTSVLGVHSTDPFPLLSDSNVQLVSDRLFYQASEKAVYAHEIVHALQHQHFEIDIDWYPTFPFNTDEAVKARRALLEGDAQFTKVMYINSCMSEQQQKEARKLFRRHSGRTENRDKQLLPQIIKDEWYFVYDEGEAFVRALYEHGGWNTVNQAFLHPPLSTEQILHPDRYLRGDLPVSVDLPVLKTMFNDDWISVDHGEIGEFLLRRHVSQFLSEDKAILASTGWGGDYYQLCERKADNAVVLMIRIVWDHQSESDQFFSVYSEYGNTRYDNSVESQSPDAITWTALNDVLFLLRHDLETIIVYAPDLITLASLKMDIYEMYK